jgi:hypothetical protein
VAVRVLPPTFARRLRHGAVRVFREQCRKSLLWKARKSQASLTTWTLKIRHW